MKATKPNRIAEPAARPSSPSVTFTALVVAKMISDDREHAQPTSPSSRPGQSDRVNDERGR